MLRPFALSKLHHEQFKTKSQPNREADKAIWQGLIGRSSDEPTLYRGTIDMKRTFAMAVVMGLLGQVSIAFSQTGIMSIPQIDTAQLETTVEIVEAAGGEPTQYIYRYTVTNPASSTDSLYKFSVDISGSVRDFLSPTLQTVPKQAGATTRPFEEEVDFLFDWIQVMEN